MNQKELGDRIARGRELAGRSQGSLGEGLGLDRSAVSRIETGERKVSVQELLTIAEILGRPLSYFVSDPVPSVVSRRRDRQHAHESTLLLDEELRAFSSDVAALLARGVIAGADRERFAFRTPRSHDEAERAATKLRERIGVARGEPIRDLGRLCDSAGLVTYAAALAEGGPDGGCVEVDDQTGSLGVAVINGQAPSGRRRMTLAHELGHWLTGDAYDREASVESERMLNSFAIHLLAPREGVTKVWRERGNWSPWERAIAVGAEYRLSWSAVIGQLSNLSLIDREEHDHLVNDLPRVGDLARLGVDLADELIAPYLSPRFTSAVLGAYTAARLTADRTLELLRGTLGATDLPEVSVAEEDLIAAEFHGHGA